MLDRRFYMSLDSKSINACIKWLETYNKSLKGKTYEFVNRLADIGIKVAYEHVASPGTFGTHKMEDYITFTKEVNGVKSTCYATIIGEGDTFISTWDNGEKSEEVFPLHYVEYGTSKNGSLRWKFVDNDGEIFERATGIIATQPMYNASRQIKLEVIDMARQVFGK